MFHANAIWSDLLTQGVPETLHGYYGNGSWSAPHEHVAWLEGEGDVTVAVWFHDSWFASETVCRLTYQMEI